jgi:hypothetical protein
MAFGLSPTSLTQILEATDFSRTVTITSSLMDPPITSIIVSRIGDTSGNLVISIEEESFTISGQYTNNFIGSLSYLDARKKAKVITTKNPFKQLEPRYFIVTEYLASLETSFVASYQVSVNGNVVGIVTQQVNNNYTPGKDSLIAAVAGGQA